MTQNLYYSLNYFYSSTRLFVKLTLPFSVLAPEHTLHQEGNPWHLYCLPPGRCMTALLTVP